jgi:hypothetical protein
MAEPTPPSRRLYRIVAVLPGGSREVIMRGLTLAEANAGRDALKDDTRYAFQKNGTMLSRGLASGEDGW